MRCCAKCKSPYGCAKGNCPCHSLFALAQQRTRELEAAHHVVVLISEVGKETSDAHTDPRP